MAEEIAVENGQISNFKGLVILPSDWVILHTVVHHSSTSTCMPIFIEIEEAFCRQTDVRTYVQMDGHLKPALLGLERVDLQTVPRVCTDTIIS